MIQNDSFWELEVDAPLLNRNAGFVNRNDVPKLVTRAAQWLDLVSAKGFVDLAKWKTSCDDEQSQRIFRLDAERTFVDESHRKDFTETLATIYEEVQDYHQGLGFIVAFLLLFMDKESAAKVAIGLHRYYVPGYFKAAPVAYVRDAKTFEKILKKKYIDVHDHVTKLVPAEAYCSKWFVGFNVHVLPFPALANFLEAFFTHGADFHFRYAVALVDNINQDLLATKDVSRVLAMLRLDHKEYPDDTVSQTGVNIPCKQVQGNSSETEEKEAGSFFTKIVDDAIFYDLRYSMLMRLLMFLHSDINVESLQDEALKEMAEYEAKRKQRELEVECLTIYPNNSFSVILKKRMKLFSVTRSREIITKAYC